MPRNLWHFKLVPRRGQNPFHDLSGAKNTDFLGCQSFFCKFLDYPRGICFGLPVHQPQWPNMARWQRPTYRLVSFSHLCQPLSSRFGRFCPEWMRMCSDMATLHWWRFCIAPFPVWKRCQVCAAAIEQVASCHPVESFFFRKEGCVSRFGHLAGSGAVCDPDASQATERIPLHSQDLLPSKIRLHCIDSRRAQRLFRHNCQNAGRLLHHIGFFLRRLQRRGVSVAECSQHIEKTLQTLSLRKQRVRQENKFFFRQTYTSTLNARWIQHALRRNWHVVQSTLKKPAKPVLSFRVQKNIFRMDFCRNWLF